MSQSNDYYALLSVPPSATTEEIQAAYRRLMRVWHPDVNGATEANRRAALINHARDVLLDPQRRAAHDRTRQPTPSARPTTATRPSAEAVARARRDAADRERAQREATTRARERAAERDAAAAAARARGQDAERARRETAEQRLAWLDHQFIAGHWYQGTGGIYEVVAVNGDSIDLRFANALTITLPKQALWEQWLTAVGRRAATLTPDQRAVFDRNLVAAQHLRWEASQRVKHADAARTRAAAEARAGQVIPDGDARSNG